MTLEKDIVEAVELYTCYHGILKRNSSFCLAKSGKISCKEDDGSNSDNLGHSSTMSTVSGSESKLVQCVFIDYKPISLRTCHYHKSLVYPSSCGETNECCKKNSCPVIKTDLSLVGKPIFLPDTHDGDVGDCGKIKAFENCASENSLKDEKKMYDSDLFLSAYNRDVKMMPASSKSIFSPVEMLDSFNFFFKNPINFHCPASFGLKMVKCSLNIPDYDPVFSRVPNNIQVYNSQEPALPRTRIGGIPWQCLHIERYRLMSFVMFPNKSPVSTIKLASKGFAYLKEEAEVICFFCYSKFGINNDEDFLHEEHERLGANCPMIKETSCNNVSMESQRPNFDIAEIFSLLNPHKNEAPIEKLPEASSSSPSDRGTNTNAKSSQPLDESASYAIVTNTSNMEETDTAAEVSGQRMQSSQLMDDSAAVANLPQSQVTSYTSSPCTADNESANIVQGSQSDGQAVQGSQSNGQAVQGSQSNGQSNDTTQQPQQSPSSESQSNTDDNAGEETSYEKLGIITARPKRLEYAVHATRLNSFKDWPAGHHMKPDDLAGAGYFYTGYSDCARCFYCGGGLRNWEAEDDVWVEHARWFPKCAFLLQEVGKDFINTVLDISKERDQIKYTDVIKRMQDTNEPTPHKFKNKNLERDPAVLSVIDNGFDRDQIFQLASEVRKKGEILASDKLYQLALNRKIPKKEGNTNLGSDSVSIKRSGHTEQDKDTADTLRKDNNELRQQTTCKICMDNEVAMVFLPCGHLVSCTECSCALTQCPLCRVGIKGIVRAYIA